MFETNFGLVRMSQAVLPGMRKRRRGSIVNVSSIGGFVGFAGVGFYNATKFAVSRGLSEALAKETAPLGIKGMIVEPGPFRTDWAGRSIKKTKSPIVTYAETAGVRAESISGNSGKQARIRSVPARPSSKSSSLGIYRCVLCWEGWRSTRRSRKSISCVLISTAKKVFRLARIILRRKRRPARAALSPSFCRHYTDC